MNKIDAYQRANNVQFYQERMGVPLHARDHVDAVARLKRHALGELEHIGKLYACELLKLLQAHGVDIHQEWK